MRVTWLALVVVTLILPGCGGSARPLQPAEGFLEVPGGRIWYRVVGSGTATPLLLLHGGPGVPSDYLGPLERLADERPVIFYDQLGAGRSDRVTDTTLFTIDHYIAELDSLRRALHLSEIHLLGHSWGSMLATDYLLGKPAGVKSVVFASTVMSASRWQRDADSLKKFLPDSSQAAIAKHEAAGTTDSPEYQAAVFEYYRRFLFRSPPPDSLMPAINMVLYQYMWGPSEFRATGTLKGYERVDRLKELSLPILFTAGEFDEGTPAAHRYYQSQTPGSKLEIIEGAAHLTMADQPEAYVAVVRQFLREVEGKR